jgi:predicted nuclease with TOPRIM domain
MPETNIFQEYAALWSMLATIFAGVGLALVNNWLGKKKNVSDLATQLRDELRNENLELKEDNRRLYQENEDLKEKVSKLQAENSRLEQRILDNRWGSEEW